MSGIQLRRTPKGGGRFGRSGFVAAHWGLTPYQIALLTFAMIAGTAVLSLPEILSGYAGQDAWIPPLLALPVGFVPLALLYDLDRRAPGRTLVEHATGALGPAAGRAVGCAFALFLASIAPIVLREFGGLITSEALPRTPAVVVLAALILVPLLLMRDGLESVARFAEVVLPLAVAAVFAIGIATVKSWQLVNMLPIGALGWSPWLQGSAPVAGFYAETALLGFVLPFRGRGWRASFAAAGAGLLCAGLLLTAATVWCILIFGPLTSRLTLVLFQVTRVASVAEFLSHLDALMIAVWMAGGLVKISVWAFAFCLAMCQSLGLRDYRPMTLPMAGFIVLGALTWFESSVQMTRWIAQTWPFWGLPFEIGVPLLIWLATVTRGRSAGRSNAADHADAMPGG